MTRAGSTHVEVERTFTADGSTQTPDLVGGVVAAARTVDDLTLRATYHDTADLRLLSAGVTLRRREGGADEGWHVKVVVGSSRLELNRPLTKSAEPPVAVRRLVQGLTRGAALVPVARVRTHRRRVHLVDDAGLVLAEVARDEVSATRLLVDEPGGEREQAWHEIEIELVAGDTRLLDQVTATMARTGIVESDFPSKLRRALGERAAPATAPVSRESTSGQAVTAYLAEQSIRLLRQNVRLRAQQPDAVRKMRTTARRLRSALAAYRRLFEAERARPLEARLRWLGRELSRARDLQVVGGLLGTALAEDTSSVSSAAAARVVRRTVAVRRRKLAAEVAALLDSDEYRCLLDELADFVAHPPVGDRSGRRARRELRRHLLRAHRRVVRRLDTVRSAETDHRGEALHAARKATKRLRYACEVAEPVMGKPARRLRRRARDLSEVLGERQDAVVLQQTTAELLVEAAADRSATDVAFVLGRVHGLQDVRVRRLESDAATAVRRVQAGKATSWLS